MPISNNLHNQGALPTGYKSPLPDSKAGASEQTALGKMIIKICTATSWVVKKFRQLPRLFCPCKPAGAHTPSTKGFGASPTQELSGTQSSPNQSVKQPIDNATRREPLCREVSFNGCGNKTGQESLLRKDEINQVTSSSRRQGLKRQFKGTLNISKANAFQSSEARLQALNPTTGLNQESIQKLTDEQIEQVSDQLIRELDDWADKNLSVLGRLDPSNTPEPTADQPLTAAQKLKQITRYDGVHGQIAKSHLVTVSTGDGETAPIHGSKVTQKEGFDPTILMQAPTEKAIGHTLNAMQQEQVSVIVDLTEEKETQAVKTWEGIEKPKVNKYYPDELGKSKTFSSGSKQFKMTLQNKDPLAAGLEKYTYILEELGANKKPVTTRPIQRLHVKTWKDHQGISPEHLKRAIQETDRIAGTGTIAVHCSAGIGRTGTFVTTRTTLHQLSDKTPGLKKTIDQLITENIKKLRKARNPKVVQGSSQVDTIFQTIRRVCSETQPINEPIYVNTSMMTRTTPHRFDDKAPSPPPRSSSLDKAPSPPPRSSSLQTGTRRATPEPYNKAHK